MVKDRVLIIDGLNVFIRHYIANPSISGNGEQIGGIVGFYYNVIKLIEKCNPEAVIVVWEGGGSKRKRDLYRDYKSGRKPFRFNRAYDQDEMPDSHKNKNFQLKTLIDLMSNLPICQIYVEDAEADDAIGYMCKYKLKNKNKIIVTGDHDFYQLVSNDCIIYSPNSKSFIDEKRVIEKYGIHPENFCVAKAMVGDKSDNIPGIPGVGFKTLAKEFNELMLKEDNETLLSDIIEINENKHRDNPKRKLYGNIKKNIELIERNVKLVRLDIDNLAYIQIKKIDEGIDNFAPTWNNTNIFKLLNINNINKIQTLNHLHFWRALKKGKIHES